MAATRAAREVIVNVSCPQCATIFRVDPAKIPERGVRARCSVCQGLIAVRRPEIAAPAVPAAPVTTAAPAPPPPPAAPGPVAPPQEASPPSPPPQEPEPRPAPTTTPPLVSPVVPLAALPEQPTSAGSPAAAPTPAQTPPSSAPAARVGNPFLQQDPATRARRLARALVSDLVVYHPEKRQRGLADGNLKELFAEEIRKSWEEYTEQVGEEIASSTPYFTEALNEILAEGRTLFG